MLDARLRSDGSRLRATLNYRASRAVRPLHCDAFALIPWERGVRVPSVVQKDHGAQAIRAYDVVKDICRVEDFTTARPGSNGEVIVISNDAELLASGDSGRRVERGGVRIGEGVLMTGARGWGPRTGDGTQRGRDKSLDVRGVSRAIENCPETVVKPSPVAAVTRPWRRRHRLRLPMDMTGRPRRHTVTLITPAISVTQARRST